MYAQWVREVNVNIRNDNELMRKKRKYYIINSVISSDAFERDENILLIISIKTKKSRYQYVLILISWVYRLYRFILYMYMYV